MFSGNIHSLSSSCWHCLLGAYDADCHGKDAACSTSFFWTCSDLVMIDNSSNFYAIRSLLKTVART
jgi:hypothetical protein